MSPGLFDAVVGGKRGVLRGSGAGAVMCCDFFGGVVAGGCNDKVVRIWDVSTERVRHSLTGHAGKIYGVRFTPDGRRLISAGTDRHVRVYDLQLGAKCEWLGMHGAVQPFETGGLACLALVLGAHFHGTSPLSPFSPSPLLRCA